MYFVWLAKSERLGEMKWSHLSMSRLLSLSVPARFFLGGEGGAENQILRLYFRLKVFYIKLNFYNLANQLILVILCFKSLAPKNKQIKPEMLVVVVLDVLTSFLKIDRISSLLQHLFLPQHLFIASTWFLFH